MSFSGDMEIDIIEASNTLSRYMYCTARQCSPLGRKFMEC